MLGLDFGGACRGIAYRVAAKQRADTLGYLRAREQATAVYRETVRVAWLAGKPERASMRYAMRSTVAIRNTPAASRTTGNCIWCARAMADPATTATM